MIEFWIVVIVALVLTTVPASVVDREITVQGWPDTVLTVVFQRAGGVAGRFVRSRFGRPRI